MADAAAPESVERTTPTNCPRCNSDLAGQEYYGVCGSCTTQLRGRFDGSARDDIATAEYEPKMNVTPNAVASKE